MDRMTWIWKYQNVSHLSWRFLRFTQGSISSCGFFITGMKYPQDRGETLTGHGANYIEFLCNISIKPNLLERTCTAQTHKMVLHVSLGLMSLGITLINLILILNSYSSMHMHDWLVKKLIGINPIDKIIHWNQSLTFKSWKIEVWL